MNTPAYWDVRREGRHLVLSPHPSSPASLEFTYPQIPSPTLLITTRSGPWELNMVANPAMGVLCQYTAAAAVSSGVRVLSRFLHWATHLEMTLICFIWNKLARHLEFNFMGDLSIVLSNQFVWNVVLVTAWISHILCHRRSFFFFFNVRHPSSVHFFALIWICVPYALCLCVILTELSNEAQNKGEASKEGPPGGTCH